MSKLIPPFQKIWQQFGLSAALLQNVKRQWAEAQPGEAGDRSKSLRYDLEYHGTGCRERKKYVKVLPVSRGCQISGAGIKREGQNEKNRRKL